MIDEQVKNVETWGQKDTDKDKPGTSTPKLQWN